jgi:hypothetical protein
VEKTTLKIKPRRKPKAVRKLTKEIKRRERTPPLAMIMKRYLAPARRSAYLEFQPSDKDFHVLESSPILGSQSLEGRQPKNDN